MAKLDDSYISKLIDKAKQNDSNAYAELYAASYPYLYSYSCIFLKDTKLAKEALEKTYTLAFSSLYHLQENDIFLLWLLEINIYICLGYQPFEQPIIINKKSYTIQQLQSLPLSEYLVMFMCYYNKLSIKDIASIMDVSTKRVKTVLNRARKKFKA